MKRMSLPVQLLALLLAALLLSGCGIRVVEKPKVTDPPAFAPETAAPASPHPTPEPPLPSAAVPTPAARSYRRGLVSFDDFRYVRPELSEAEAHIERAQTLLAEQASGEDVLAEYEALEAACQQLQNASTLAELYSSMNVNDSFYQDESIWLVEALNGLSNRIIELELAIEASPVRDVVLYDWTEQDYDDLHVDAMLYDEEYTALAVREEELVNAYWDILTNTTVAYAGRECTVAELETMDLPDPVYYRLLGEYDSKTNALAGEVYLELVELRKRIAEKAGYDSFIDYAYEHLYHRDYSPAEAQALWDYAKQYVAPQVQQYLLSCTEEDYALLDAALAEEDPLTVMQPMIERYVDEISPEMREAYDYLIEYRLSLLTDSPDSEAGAYTTFLTAYDVPFLYMSLYGGYNDVMTFIHEFGHFTNFYLCGEDALYLNTLDVLEIHSQGSEALFLPCLEEYFDEATAAAITKQALYSLLSSIVDGCLHDEFQQRVFSGSYDSVEELNALFLELSAEYCMDPEMYYIDLSTYWSQIPHTFQSPFYYISYAVSSVPVLELLARSQEDRAAAIELYGKLLSAEPGVGFSALLEENGMQPAFSEQAVLQAVEAVAAATGVGAGASAGG